MSTALERTVARDKVAPCNVCAWHGSAADEATRASPATVDGRAERWDWHTAALRSPGNVAAAGAATSAQPTNYEMYHAARTRHARIFLLSITAAIRQVGAMARQAFARGRQRRQADIVSDVLRRLDDCTLRDLSCHRSEITSLAAEVAGIAERTRVRAIAVSEAPDRGGG